MQNPWALFALATLALPWLFLRRRRPTTPPPRVSLPTIRLLTPTLQRAARRKERRLIALAAIRTCALLTLVLIWTAPSFRSFSFFNAATTLIAAKPELSKSFQRVANGQIDGRPIRVLIVDGSDSGPPFPNAPEPQNAASRSNDAAFYLAAALNPDFNATQPVEAKRFPRVEIVSSADFALTPSAALTAFDAICWVDLGAPTDAELEKTERFLAAATTDSPRALLIFAGPRIDAKRWDAVWRQWNLDVQTLAVAFEPATGALDASTDAAVRDALQTVAQTNVKERVFAAAFPGFDRSGVDALPVWRSFPLVGRAAVPVLRDATTNAPTLTRLSAPNNGVVLWCATAPDASISALAFAPSFVPFVEKAFDFALQESLATHCVSDASNVNVFPESSTARVDQTQKTAAETLDKPSARRRLSLVFWGTFALLIAFEFRRSATLNVNATRYCNKV